VSRGYSSSCVLSFRLLPAPSAVGPFCNWRTSPSVTSCTFLVANGRVGPLFTIDRLLWVLAVLLMAALPGHYDVGQAGDGDSVAPARISALLATSRRGSAKSSGLWDESSDLWYGDEPPGRPLEAESLTLDPSAR
jgi:hypothetical protein